MEEYIYILHIYVYHVLVDGVVWCNPLIIFNSLIVRNNPFGVDFPLTEKNQEVDLHKQGLKTVPE